MLMCCSSLGLPQLSIFNGQSHLLVISHHLFHFVCITCAGLQSLQNATLDMRHAFLVTVSGAMSCSYRLLSHFCLKTTLFRPDTPTPLWTWGMAGCSRHKVTCHFHTAVFNMALKFSFTSPDNWRLFFSLDTYANSLEHHPFKEFPP